jgi:hypothetical protein
MPPRKPATNPKPGRVKPRLNVTLDLDTFETLAEIQAGNPDLTSQSAVIRWLARQWRATQKRPRKKS